MRSSRYQSPTGRPGRPEAERSPLNPAWKGSCAAGAATAEPPWPAEPAPQLAGPSVRKLKVSYVRAGAGRGGRDPAARSRRAPPSRPLQPRCSPPGRSTQGRQGGVEGVGGKPGLQPLAETRPPAPHPGPPPQTGPEPAGTARQAPSSGRELSDPLPASPAPPRTLNFGNPRPPATGLPVRNWGPGTSIAPPILRTRPLPAPRGTPRALGECVRLSLTPVPPGTRACPPGGPGSPGLDRAGTWPGRAGPRSRPPPLSPFKRFLPLCPFGGLHLH